MLAWSDPHHNSKITFSFYTLQLREVQRRQSRLKRHKHRQQPRNPAVAFPEGVNQNQFHMHLGQRSDHILDVLEPAWSQAGKLVVIELPHQLWQMGGRCEQKASLADINCARHGAPRPAERVEGRDAGRGECVLRTGPEHCVGHGKVWLPPLWYKTGNRRYIQRELPAATPACKKRSHAYRWWRRGRGDNGGEDQYREDEAYHGEVEARAKWAAIRQFRW